MNSVVEAAIELGVSERRVRQLLQSGDLNGNRVGRSWVIDHDALIDYKARARLNGRPWNPMSAWALLAAASGMELDISSMERSRARKRLRENSWEELRAGLRNRASVRRFYVHPAALDRLRRDEALVLAGVSAAPHVGADLVDLESEVDAYIDGEQLADLVDRFVLDAESQRPNVILRVIDHDDWPFSHGQRIVPREVAAIDMAEHSESRVRRAGLALLDAQ
jgi:excisionase family DNA binding protein